MIYPELKTKQPAASDGGRRGDGLRLFEEEPGLEYLFYHSRQENSLSGVSYDLDPRGLTRTGTKIRLLLLPINNVK